MHAQRVVYAFINIHHEDGKDTIKEAPPLLAGPLTIHSLDQGWITRRSV
jgi:hypothetical protein